MTPADVDEAMIALQLLKQRSRLTRANADHAVRSGVVALIALDMLAVLYDLVQLSRLLI